MKNRYSWRNAGKKLFSVMSALLMAVAFGGFTQAQTTCEINNMQGPSVTGGYLALWDTTNQGMAVLFDPGATGAVGDPGCFLNEPYTYTVDSVKLNMLDAGGFGLSGLGTLEYKVTLWEAGAEADCDTIGTQIWVSDTLTEEMDDTGFHPIAIPVGQDVSGAFFVSVTTVSWSGDDGVAPSAVAWDSVERPNCRQYILIHNADGELVQVPYEDFFTVGGSGWGNITVVGSHPEVTGTTVDLQVNEVTTPAEVYLGVPTTVSVNVTNNGDLNIAGGTLSLMEDGVEVSTADAYVAAGATTTIEVDYTPSILGEVSLTVTGTVADDTDDTNNEGSTTVTVTEPPSLCAIENQDFEGFAEGDYLAVNSDNWSTWSGTGGGTAEDVQISTAQANSGSNSVEITGDATDALMLLGDAAAGMWEVTKMMYVPTGSSAYWNLQGSATPGDVYVFECYMNADGTGEISTDAGNVVEGFGEYPQGEWFEVRLTADLDQEVVNIYFDGNFVNQIQSPDDINLSSFDYYPVGGDGADVASRTYYIDDVNVCPIDNEDPCTAFALEMDATIEGDNTDAEIFDETVVGSCWGDGGTTDGDVWFEFTVPEDGGYNVSTNLEELVNDDTQLAAYTGDCDGELTEIGCGEDIDTENYLSEMDLTGLTAGTVVYIQVDGYNGTAGAFQILVSMLANPPANDECADAIDLTDLTGLGEGESAYSDVATNIDATSGDEEMPSCFADGTGGTEASVWFTFEGDGGTYYIETMNCEGEADPLNEDTQMAIYEGSCGSLTEIACNDDIDLEGENYLSGLELETEEGVTYYIMIDGYTLLGATSLGEFCISFSNDVSVGENSKIDYSLYPNPTNGNVTLTASETIEGVRVLDMVGKVVKTVGIDAATQVDINVSDLPSGVYFVEVSAAGNQYVERLIVE